MGFMFFAALFLGIGAIAVLSAAQDELAQGVEYFNKGMYDEAIASLDKAIENNPADAEAFRYRGLVYDKKNDLDRAISEYNNALQINPSNADAWRNRGLAYAYQGNLDQAIADYTKAIELEQNCASLNIRRRETHQVAGLDANKLLESNPDYTPVVSGKVGDAGKTEATTQTISEYSQIIAMNPECAEAYYDRAIAYYFNKKYDRALEDVEKAQALGYQVEPEFLDELTKASAHEE